MRVPTVFASEDDISSDRLQFETRGFREQPFSPAQSHGLAETQLPLSFDAASIEVKRQHGGCGIHKTVVAEHH
jgi:hypothetical protein